MLSRLSDSAVLFTEYSTRRLNGVINHDRSYINYVPEDTPTERAVTPKMQCLKQKQK